MKHLLPEEIREQPWAREIATFKPSICHFDLFLGFEGNITQYGAEEQVTVSLLNRLDGNMGVTALFA